MTPQEKYPALMAYIADRSSEEENTAWKMLRADEAAAVEGDYAEVAQELESAQVDYAAAQIAKGGSAFPSTARWASSSDYLFEAITNRRVATTLRVR